MKRLVDSDNRETVVALREVVAGDTDSAPGTSRARCTHIWYNLTQSQPVTEAWESVASIRHSVTELFDVTKPQGAGL